MALRLNIIIEKDADGYYAYCPELPGCQTEGRTVEKTLEHIKEAAELYLETLTRSQQRKLTCKQVMTTSVEVAVA